jgi:hypothetical protein
MPEPFMTKRHFGLLHVARQRLGIAEDDWRALLRRAASVERARALDEHGFARVVAELERLGFRSSWSRITFGGTRPGMATPGQLALIRALWRDFTDGRGDDASLGRLMAGKGWPSHLRFLDGQTARKVIGALRMMVLRRSGGLDAGPRPAA